MTLLRYGNERPGLTACWAGGEIFLSVGFKCPAFRFMSQVLLWLRSAATESRAHLMPSQGLGAPGASRCSLSPRWQSRVGHGPSIPTDAHLSENRESGEKALGMTCCNESSWERSPGDYFHLMQLAKLHMSNPNWMYERPGTCTRRLCPAMAQAAQSSCCLQIPPWERTAVGGTFPL